MNSYHETAGGRVDWVDYAKGLCIVMVVMMHSTLGVEAAAGREGYMHVFVSFAKPFRMPDFFLISGLFLSNVIGRDWRTYLDRKVVHFAYFYVLWMTIQFAFKSPAYAAEHGALEAAKLYALSFIQPFGTLWFIYLLPIFFVITKLTRQVFPRHLPPAIVWLAAAALEIAHFDTGWTVIDECANRFVYFYTGYVLAPHIFRLAAKAQTRPWHAGFVLTAWAIANAGVVYAGYSEMPFVSLGLGLIGAAAIVRVSALLAKSNLCEPLRYCGENSIVIYLAFFLPMAATRTFLLSTDIIPYVGSVSLFATAAGVIGPLLLFWLTRGSRLDFLFRRPDRFWLAPKPRMTMQPAG
jgi:uncharacterized membrane protein YcfT